MNKIFMLSSPGSLNSRSSIQNELKLSNGPDKREFQRSTLLDIGAPLQFIFAVQCPPGLRSEKCFWISRKPFICVQITDFLHPKINKRAICKWQKPSHHVQLIWNKLQRSIKSKHTNKLFYIIFTVLHLDL